MVHHVIIWRLREELNDSEKAVVRENAKSALEALVGRVPGLVSLTLHVSSLPSSNGDMMLDSVLESEHALAEYQLNPDHVAAANKYVRPFTHTRLCFDFSEKNDDET